MSRLNKIRTMRVLRAKRVRKSINGTSVIPRLSVHISNRNVSAQLIDDSNSKTIAYVSSVSFKSKSNNKSELATEIGKQIALKAKTLKIKKAVFDRGSKLYHGRIKLLADSARENGLEI